MKYKKKFLNELTTELKSRKIESEDIIEYYTEMIDEKIASGSTENKAVKALGDMDDIIKDIEINHQLSEAKKKPTLSNGVRALIAVLGVLSLPILIPVICVIFALLITLGAIWLSIIVIFISVIAALIGVIVGSVVGVVAGEIPVAMLILTIGLVLILMPLCIEAIRGLVFLIKKFITWLAGVINGRRSRKGEEK